MVKHPPAIQETPVWLLGWEDPLEKGWATHSSILAWKIPWTEETRRLQCLESERVGHDLALSFFHEQCRAGKNTFVVWVFFPSCLHDFKGESWRQSALFTSLLAAASSNSHRSGGVLAFCRQISGFLLTLCRCDVWGQLPWWVRSMASLAAS